MKSFVYFFILFILASNFLGCPWEDEVKYVVRRNTLNGNCVIRKEGEFSPGDGSIVASDFKSRKDAKDWICSHRGTDGCENSDCP